MGYAYAGCAHVKLGGSEDRAIDTSFSKLRCQQLEAHDAQLLHVLLRKSGCLPWQDLLM